MSLLGGGKANIVIGRIHAPEEEEDEDEEWPEPEETIDSLSDFTRAALLEHLAFAERDQEKVLGDEIKEDYGLSQFWYDDETATALANEVRALMMMDDDG